MSYDMVIMKESPGEVRFELPTRAVYGTHKLMQRVILLLFSDDGELSSYVGGQTNAQSLTDSVMIRETARVFDAINGDLPSDYTDDEKLDSMELNKLEMQGTSVSIDISVTTVSGNIESTIINL